MKATDMVVFQKGNEAQVIEELGFRCEANGDSIHVLTSEGHQAVCDGCQKELTVERVGTVAPGSRLLFCDNPLCFSTWIANNRIDP